MKRGEGAIKSWGFGLRIQKLAGLAALGLLGILVMGMTV